MPGFVEAIDIADPRQPYRLDRIALAQAPTRLILEGDELFVAQSFGVQVIDVSDPSALVSVLGQQVPDDWEALFHRQPSVTEMALTERSILMLNRQGRHAMCNGLRMHEQSGAAVGGEQDHLPAFDFGNWSSFTMRQTDLVLQQEVLYATTDRKSGLPELAVVDLRDPQRATAKARSTYETTQGLQLAASDSRLYVAGALLQTFDISDPAEPRPLALTDPGLIGTQPVHDLALQGEVAILTSGVGFDA